MKNLLLISVLLSMCMSTTLHAQTVSEEILQQNRNMEAAYNTGEVTAVANYYTNNAAIVGPGTEVLGKTAIVAYWKGLEGRNVHWKLENSTITDYNEVAIQRGISHLTFLHNDKEMTSVMRFTLVWIRENDQWKINIDHYSPI